MATRILGILLAGLMLASSVYGESIQGTVVIKKRLTKRRVTASAPMYQRGTAVALGSDSETDPIAFEMSRVAVYVENHQVTGVPEPLDPAVSSLLFTMAQKNRRFTAETLVIPVGSKVSFPNMDPIFHNVFSLSPPKAFDLGNYPKGETRTVAFLKPGIVYVNCRLHPNMSAAIVVTPNEWSAGVDRDGHFEIRGVPPGIYTVTAWHRAAGFFRRDVTVARDTGAKTEFLMPLDVDGSELRSRTGENTSLAVHR